MKDIFILLLCFVSLTLWGQTNDAVSYEMQVGDKTYDIASIRDVGRSIDNKSISVNTQLKLFFLEMWMLWRVVNVLQPTHC